MNYLDKKFFDLHQTLSGRYSNFLSYDVEIFNDFTGSPLNLSIQIETNFQDVLNEIYFAIDSHIEAFTYMESWLIVNETKMKALAIRGVADQIPAHCLFGRDEEYRILKLSKPYKTSIVSNHPDFASRFPS
ncbi:MAG: hypothetical protein ACKO1N_03425 [Erythrobacter sp.]